MAIQTPSVTSCITKFVQSAKRQERLVDSVRTTKVNTWMVFLELNSLQACEFI